MKARDRDVHGALDAFLATGGLANRDQRRYSLQAPCIVACQGLRGIRTKRYGYRRMVFEF
jgi:hypothetical protein